MSLSAARRAHAGAIADEAVAAFRADRLAVLHEFSPEPTSDASPNEPGKASQNADYGQHDNINVNQKVIQNGRFLHWNGKRHDDGIADHGFPIFVPHSGQTPETLPVRS